jgi:glycine hydroxymethyltransferase
LAITLLDWKETGHAYATEMVDSANALASNLLDAGLPVVLVDGRATRSHAFALRADATNGDGHALAKRLRTAGLLTSGIGLPSDTGALMGGIRLGTNEMVRWGMTTAHMAEIAGFITRAIASDDLDAVAADVARFRSQFTDIHFCA